MPPAELNEYAATQIMGYKALMVNCSGYHPVTCHNQCQQVIEKAIEKGVDRRRIEEHIIASTEAESILLATAEQKLRALHAAWQEKE